MDQTKLTMGPSLARSFLTFSAVGAIATGLHYAILITLVIKMGADPVLSSLVGYCMSAIVNYWLNYHLTFNSTKAHLDAFPKFLLVAGTGLLLNTGLMAVGVYGLDMNYLVVQVVTTLLVLVWNYFANRLWSFREKTHITTTK